MAMLSPKKNRWTEELQELETELLDLPKKYPIHSIRPHLEELEERIRVLKEKIEKERE